MTFWEFMGVALSSAGLFASILGAFLTYAARMNGAATRDLIRSMEERLTAVLERMDQRADERRRSMEERLTAVLERMDQRADERHQEFLQALRALKTP